MALAKIRAMGILSLSLSLSLLSPPTQLVPLFLSSSTAKSPPKSPRTLVPADALCEVARLSRNVAAGQRDVVTDDAMLAGWLEVKVRF